MLTPLKGFQKLQRLERKEQHVARTLARWCLSSIVNHIHTRLSVLKPNARHVRNTLLLSRYKERKHFSCRYPDQIQLSAPRTVPSIKIIERVEYNIWTIKRWEELQLSLGIEQGCASPLPHNSLLTGSTQGWDGLTLTMPVNSIGGRPAWWQSWPASAPLRLMGIKPQRPSFVAALARTAERRQWVFCAQFRADWLGSPPRNPWCHGLGMQGGRKEREDLGRGDASLSSLSQTQSPDRK